MAYYKHFSIERQGTVTEIMLSNMDYFDVVNYSEFHEELMQFIEHEKPENLLVRFDEVKYCSTAIIGALLKARHRQEASGRKIKICGMCDSVRRGFEMLKLVGSVFDVCDDETTALAAF